MDRSFWLAKAAKFLVAVALFITVATFVTQYLWNWLVPSLFHGPALSLGQTLGLLALSRLLFGNWGRGGGSKIAQGRAWKKRLEERMATLTPEEREKLRQQLRTRYMSNWPKTAEVTD